VGGGKRETRETRETRERGNEGTREGGKEGTRERGNEGTNGDVKVLGVVGAEKISFAAK
jgi:hypothetical protein